MQKSLKFSEKDIKELITKKVQEIEGSDTVCSITFNVTSGHSDVRDPREFSGPGLASVEVIIN